MADYGKVWGVRQTSKVKALYENSEARVRVEGELTDCLLTALSSLASLFCSPDCSSDMLPV